MRSDRAQPLPVIYITLWGVPETGPPYAGESNLASVSPTRIRDSRSPAIRSYIRLNAVVADICRSRTIAAEPQSIWDALADFGAISSWADIVDHSCLLSPAAEGIAVGTARRVQLGRDTLVERITEFDPPRALAYDVDGLPRQLRRVNNRWTLTPSTGGTAVTLASTVDVGSNPLQRFAERIVARVSAKQLDALLAGLTQKLEGSRA
jgi:uncharacterized protein YndB with AHSA1/START domain